MVSEARLERRDYIRSIISDFDIACIKFAWNSSIGLFYYTQESGIYKEDKKEDWTKYYIRCRHQDLEPDTMEDIVEIIKQENFKPLEDFNANKNIITLNNCNYNLKTDEASPFTPEIINTVRIPINFDASAQCPQIDQFILQTVAKDDIPVIEELFGFLLTSGYQRKYIFIFVGGINAGKSVVLNLITFFLDNKVSNLTPHKIVTDRFAAAELYGKKANISGDISGALITDTSILKMLIGGDDIYADKKFGGVFSFKNQAKLIFATNTMPIIPDSEIDIFMNKIKVINFPNYFPDDKQDVHLLAKITSPQEMSGLFNKAITGLKRLNKNNHFSNPISKDRMIGQYFSKSDPVIRFVKDMVEINITETAIKDDILTLFREYCDLKHIAYPKTNNTFWKVFKSSLPREIDYNKYIGSGTNRKYAIGGIRLKQISELEESQKEEPHPQKEPTTIPITENQDDQERINSIISLHKEYEPDIDFGINIPQDFPEPVILPQEEIDRINWEIQEIKKREQEEEEDYDKNYKL